MALTYYSTKHNTLVELFEQNFEVQKIQQPSLTKKIFSKKRIHCNIFFQYGNIDKKNKQLLLEADICIVSSILEKQKLVDFGIEKNKIEVIYPFVQINQLDKQTARKRLEQYKIDQDKSIILFMSNNFQFGGAKEFLSHISLLEYSDYQAIMVGSKKDIEMTHYYLKNYKEIQEKIFFIQKDSADEENIFASCDIYVAPTKVQTFSSNILKAMSYGSAVFVSSYNGAFEIVDTYSKMDGCEDASLPFKIDMLLKNPSEFELISKENIKRSKLYSKENILKKLQIIVDNIST